MKLQGNLYSKMEISEPSITQIIHLQDNGKCLLRKRYLDDKN